MTNKKWLDNAVGLDHMQTYWIPYSRVNTKLDEKDKRIAELEKHIASLPQLENPWISVEDELPDFTGHVLVAYGDRVTTAFYLKFENSERHGRWGEADGKPEAWMSLPEPLKEKGDE